MGLESIPLGRADSHESGVLFFVEVKITWESNALMVLMIRMKLKFVLGLRVDHIMVESKINLYGNIIVYIGLRFLMYIGLYLNENCIYIYVYI